MEMEEVNVRTAPWRSWFQLFRYLPRTTRRLRIWLAFLWVAPLVHLCIPVHHAVTPLQPKGLKIYISADMEGVGGVVTSQQTSLGGLEYQRFRHFMTAEVNAAIGAAFEAGATEIVVSDSHGNGQNLLVEELHPEARLIRSWPRPLLMVQGIDESFDAAIFIGYHSAEQTAEASLAHTFSGGKIFEIRINGISVPEAGFNAATAGYFGVPVVMISGDQTIIQQTRSLLGDVEAAVVKKAFGNTSAETMHPSKAQALIAERTRAASARLDDFRPYRPWQSGENGQPGPVDLEIIFKSETDAQLLSLLRGVERTGGSSIRFRAKDILEAAHFLAVVVHYNR